MLNENHDVLIKISLKFVPEGLTNNNSVLVQVMTWRRTGAKSLPEPMMMHLNRKQNARFADDIFKSILLNKNWIEAGSNFTEVCQFVLLLTVTGVHDDWHIESLSKWATYCRRHFQMCWLIWKLFHFDSIFAEVYYFVWHLLPLECKVMNILRPRQNGRRWRIHFFFQIKIFHCDSIFIEVCS